MPICNKCNLNFPNKVVYNNKQLFCNKRKYCLSCSPPFTRKLCGPKKQHKKSNTGTCKTCFRVYNLKTNLECSTCRVRAIRNKQRTKAISLLGGSCVNCGYNKCEHALDFHHKDVNSKQFTLSSYWHLAWSKIEIELAKCELLCSNCHREYHSK